MGLPVPPRVGDVGTTHPLDVEEGDRPPHQRRNALLAAAVIVAVVVGVVIWQNAGGPRAVSTVRYVNDTRARLVVTPCGVRQRCVIEAGASVIGRPPPKHGVTPRVTDARTHRIFGCLAYTTGERTVHLSDAAATGGTC